MTESDTSRASSERPGEGDPFAPGPGTQDPEAVLAQVRQKSIEYHRQRRRRQLRISIGLFIATFISTTLVGSNFEPWAMFPGLIDTSQQKQILSRVNKHYPLPAGTVMTFQQRYADFALQGLSYSCPLMMILLCHEMGHYLQAVRYRIPATYPFFIPLPLPPLGTMGAVIAQQRGIADRKQMFDIAVSGPLAGLIATLPVLYYGIKASSVDVIPPGPHWEFGEPYVIRWFIQWIHGPVPDGQTLFMNGFAMAGWVGVFITALNLLPVGQLDGGHLTYTMLGKSAHWIAVALVLVAAAAMYLTRTYSYIVFLVLIMFMGTRHPPTRDDTVPLGATRHIIGWLTLAFLFIGFTMTPIVVKNN